MNALLLFFELKDWITAPNIVGGLLTLLGLTASAYFIVRSRRAETTHEQNTRAISAWEKTAGAFEKNLTAANAALKELEDERDALKTAYATLSGVDIKEILNNADKWRENALLIENASLRRANADLARRLSVYEPTAKGSGDGN